MLLKDVVALQDLLLKDVVALHVEEARTEDGRLGALSGGAIGRIRSHWFWGDGGPWAREKHGGPWGRR